ncbi:flagellar FliJ family protein [Solicola sp. PLA-1-18]|uniref:flagellar FliJ family protein n=1 Tax=Solicola sp. PLA-1-18 TaxID=3380532 RepID=UPI003B79FD81
MTRRPREDDGLSAVERVRGVREQDSLIGLQHSLTTQAERHAAAEAARARLAMLPAFQSGTGAQLLAARAVATQMADACDEARSSAETADRLTVESRGRWQDDRTRLRAVELLLQRRADVRATERRRAEDRDLDDVAGQGWMRRRRELRR